jgi:4'-phosphopantetheinyl transferase
MTSISLTPWQAPPSHVHLDGRTVHLWRFRLDLPSTDISALKSLLTDDELARAERLIVPVKSRDFVVARGRMRQILSRYLDRTPSDIKFAYGEHGKPRLASDENLSFNLSHAGCWGLLGIVSGTEIGVDVEKMKPRLEFEKIADRFFSPAEVKSLEQYSPARSRRGFFRIWTRKEAFLKGQGFGFSAPASVDHDAAWMLRSFVVDRGYLGAVAVACQIESIHRWDFPLDAHEKHS